MILQALISSRRLELLVGCFLMSMPFGITFCQTPSTPPPPNFKASGIEGNTAPSGYAAGASEAYSKKVATLVPALQEADLFHLLPLEADDGCVREPELLRAVSAAPDKFEPNAQLGRFYLYHANPSLALRYLAVALKRRPDDREMLRYAAIAALQSKNYAGAAESIHRLLQIGGDDASAHKLSGELNAALGHSGEAVREFGTASQLDPSADNLYSAALAELAFGTLPSAVAAFESATKLHPESSELWLGSGITALLAGHKADAGDFLWKAKAGAATGLLALTLLAMQDGGDQALDRDTLQELEHLSRQRYPDAMQDAIIHYDYAMLLGKSKAINPSSRSSELRREQLELAVKEQPNFAAAHFQLGVLASESDNPSVAAAELARATALDDDIPEWHYRLSRVDRRLNLVPDAEREFRRFEELKAAHVPSTAGDELLEGMPLRSLIGIAVPCPVPRW